MTSKTYGAASGSTNPNPYGGHGYRGHGGGSSNNAVGTYVKNYYSKQGQDHGPAPGQGGGSATSSSPPPTHTHAVSTSGTAGTTTTLGSNYNGNKREMDILLEEMKKKNSEMQKSQRVRIEIPKNALQHRFIDLVAHYAARCGHGFENVVKEDIRKGKVLVKEDNFLKVLKYNFLPE
ncbi:unnamed protein product [Amoebophrya sp. A25]|nr:unnamed protein product [Amoebophrya sp. A25]|eukprot:GSA25T00023253001.1